MLYATECNTVIFIIFRLAMQAACDTSKYTIEYRIMAAAWRHDSDQSRTAMMLLRNKLRDKFPEEPPEPRVIKQWREKLFTTGTIFDKARSGRPNERGDTVEVVREAIGPQCITSTRRLSDELDIPRTSLRRIMKEDLQLKAWKPTKVQFLTPADHEKRVHCCQLILQKYNNTRLKNKLFFSDECAIYTSARPSNVVMWSKENPHFWQQVEQHPPKVMIWAAMSAQLLIGPFFIHGRVDAARYIQLLREEVIPELERKGALYSCHFHQDGAPPHTALATREFLDSHFPGRWVGKFAPIEWPARSPDLTSCDNALWGIVKRCVRQANPNTVDEIKQSVRAAFNDINAELLNKINDRTFRRLQLCIDINGLQVDPFDQ